MKRLRSAGEMIEASDKTAERRAASEFQGTPVVDAIGSELQRDNFQVSQNEGVSTERSFCGWNRDAGFASLEGRDTASRIRAEPRIWLGLALATRSRCLSTRTIRFRHDPATETDRLLDASLQHGNQRRKMARLERRDWDDTLILLFGRNARLGAHQIFVNEVLRRRWPRRSTRVAGLKPAGAAQTALRGGPALQAFPNWRQAFPNLTLGFCKLFQRFLWRFC